MPERSFGTREVAVLLESWVTGRWLRPDDEGVPLLHAATGDDVARVSAAPVAARAALSPAREVGGPALRDLTFPQRAALLRQLGTHLMEVEESFAELSHATGATATRRLGRCSPAPGWTACASPGR